MLEEPVIGDRGKGSEGGVGWGQRGKRTNVCLLSTDHSMISFEVSKISTW